MAFASTNIKDDEMQQIWKLCFTMAFLLTLIFFVFSLLAVPTISLNADGPYLYFLHYTLFNDEIPETISNFLLYCIG